MNVMWATLQKETREALRDKRTLFLTVLMPLIFYPALIALTGWMTSNQVEGERVRGLDVGVMGMDDLSVFGEVEGVRFAQAEGNAEGLLDGEDFDVVLEFGDVSELGQREVTLHYLGTVSGEVGMYRVQRLMRGVTKNVVEGRMVEHGIAREVLVPFLLEEEDHASVRASAGSKYGGIGAYFLVFLAFTGCMAVAIDTSAGEKERGTLEAMLATPARFVSVAAGKLIYISGMGLLSVLATVGGIGLLLVLGAMMTTGGIGGMTVWSVLGGCFLLVLTVVFFASLLFGVSIMSRTSKEAHLKAALLMLVVAMTLIYCTLPGVPVGGGMMFVPMLNVALALRGLWEGVLGFGQFVMVAGMMGVLAMGMLWGVSWLVRRNPERALLK